MSGALCLMTIIAQKSGGVIADFERVPLDSRVANMFVSYMRYIGKMIWPSGLSVFYPRTKYSEEAVIICALAFLLITAACIYIGRRKKYIAAGWLWFAGTLVPMIGLVQAGSQSMANRYMYISIVGLVIIIGWAVKEIIENYPGMKYIAGISSIIILCVLVLYTREQVKHWENNLTLFEYALKVTEKNALVENNYGTALLERGRTKEAEIHLASAVQLNPAYFDAYTNLGAAYVQLGKYEAAIKNFNKALELKPDYTDALNNLAWLLATSENPSYENPAMAIELAKRACELTNFKNPSMLDTLAAAYAADGNFDEAVKTAQQAINIARTKREIKLADEIEGRLKLYQSKQRYKQK
jgi:Tfp pilus assembly protein PilF